MMGTSVDKGETAMDTHDWKTQLPAGSRQKIVNRIMETLHKHLPFSGPEGMEDLRGIASRFEEKIFSGAVSQTDYLRTISMKMLSMQTRCCHQMTVEGSVKAEPAANIVDWRTCLPPDSRKKNADKIKGTLQKHVPNCGKEGNKELEKIAASFEELIFNTAIDQVDYLHKTSFKITP